jgi:hypothetical protein
MDLIVFEGYIPRPLGRISSVPLTKYVGMYPEKNTLPNQPTPLLAAGLVDCRSAK